MAPIILFLLLALSFTASAQRQTNITLGSSLTPITNSSWLSPSGLYAFGFFRQRNGYSLGVFLSGISLKTVVWAARRDDAPVPGNATLLFTSDGRVVLTSAQGGETLIVSASQPASLASMSDSGNFVLYNSDREIIWQSFDHPTDTLLPTQQLKAGAELFSPVSETELSTGIYRLKMQNDGNLVQYPVNTPDTGSYAYFASGTDGAGDNVTLNLDPDGRLYLLNSTGFNIKNITAGGYPTKEAINMMKLDTDGIFRLYSQNLTRNGNRLDVWSSTSNKCDPKGSCGLNGYCVMKDKEAECTCLPGFEFVSQGNGTSGCERDFDAENESRCPKVSDFGLAKLLKSDQTKTFTGIRGTRGYVAPEWHRNMPVTVKADVYSFGVMLLEITCCRKNVDWLLPEDEAVLEQWVYQCFQDGDMDKLVGDEIVDKKELDRMVKVGLWCTLDEPSLRPSMKKVLLMLEGTVEIPIPPSPTSFFTAI
uniref:Bulb-type lectin domain-containing protein n=1 Tax=Populus trichocarpa TaxID=3694 RepID=A0A2K2AC54_POPTR